jgi:DNA-binding MurR/RpiR family transcriptional regulator
VKARGEKFSRSSERAIVALLSEPTIQEAALKSGISETTLWRWLQRPDFNEQYREARKRMVEVAIAQLQQACGEAVTTLRTVMKNTRAAPSARVMAAKACLDTTLKKIEADDLEARISELEKIISQSGATTKFG